MKPFDLFKFSVDNLRRRKGRTVLTVVGVVVGVCAIVVMISLGIAVNRAADEMLQGWGDLTKIEVYSFGAQAGTPDLDDKMVENFRSIPHVIAATPIYQPTDIWGQLASDRSGKFISDGTSLVGMDPAAIELMGYKLVTGSWDVTAYLGKGKIPALIGEQVPFAFHNPKKSWNSPDAQKYPQYDENYTTIMNLPQYDENGVLQNPEEFFFDVMNSKLIYRMNIGFDDETGESKYQEYEIVPVGMISGGMNDWTVSNGIVMSLENVKLLEADHKRATGSNSGGGGGFSTGMYGGGDQSGTVNVGGYSSVYVKVDDVKNVESVEKALKEIGYQIYSMSETRKQLQSQVAQTQLMLGGLAAVSLFVAALNIMNTMTMAITERTREIGIMKVLGCRLRDIRNMFLIESGAIGLLGGGVGCIVSVLISLLLNNLTTLLSFLGVQGNVDIAGFFGLSGMADQMPGMNLSIIPAWLILFALAFATGVGLISGIGPARQATRISSLEAIRRE
ncbi:MAG: ABC transporter permease [Clostridiales Family XIII bacterium]|jgi:ABC-type antimicrobial peptide transport system permease subunit|nr:ABC transporter permease [Clostridiales Family XIII bacterium]